MGSHGVYRGMSRTSVYVAGPMRGQRLFNYPAFDEARDMLVSQGYAVISPADLDRAAGFNPATDTPGARFMAQAVRRDLEALLLVDAIACLEGWEQSEGTLFELTVARKLGLDVYRIRDGHLEAM